jgi:hypothetical protein
MATSKTAASPVEGSQLVALARRHLGDKYVLGVLVPKDNAEWKGPWDCAEFASWVVFQATGRLYGCSDDSAQPTIADAYTGFWQQDALRLGQIVSIDLASRTAGAFVLRIPQHGAVGHIVISDGRGGTVEAHSSKYGVIASKLAKRRWDKGIFVPGIRYTQGPAVKVPTPDRGDPSFDDSAYGGRKGSRDSREAEVSRVRLWGSGRHIWSSNSRRRDCFSTYLQTSGRRGSRTPYRTRASDQARAKQISFWLGRPSRP